MQNYDIGKIGYLSEIKQHKMDEHERHLKLNIAIVWTRALIFLFPDFSVGRRTSGLITKQGLLFLEIIKKFV